jgi:hypothetical protein
MQSLNTNQDYKENTENFENFYFKIYEFKEDFINQIISNTEMIQSSLDKAEIIMQFHSFFNILEKNRVNLKESKIIFSNQKL